MTNSFRPKPLDTWDPLVLSLSPIFPAPPLSPILNKYKGMALNYKSYFSGALPSIRSVSTPITDGDLPLFFFFRLLLQCSTSLVSGHTNSLEFIHYDCLPHFLFALQKKRYVGPKRWELCESISKCSVSGKTFSQRRVTKLFIWKLGFLLVPQIFAWIPWTINFWTSCHWIFIPASRILLV